MAVNPLFLKKKTGRIALTTFFIAIFNIGLNLLLIPKFGILGAAWATAAAYLAFFVIIYFLAKKEYPIPYQWQRLAQVFFTGLIIFFVGIIFVPSQPLILTISIKLGLLITFPIVLFVLKFFTENEVKKVTETLSLLMKGLKT